MPLEKTELRKLIDKVLALADVGASFTATELDDKFVDMLQTVVEQDAALDLLVAVVNYITGRIATTGKFDQADQQHVLAALAVDIDGEV